MKKISIALTGHRPHKLAGYNYNNSFYKKLYNELDKIIKQTLKEYDVLTLHSGMALGADTIWAKVIIDNASLFPNKIKFIADVPNMEQWKRWPQESKNLWLKLMQYADETITYENKYPGKSYAYVLNARNWGMIDHCETLIAVYDSTQTGGTANAVKYALSKKKKIIYINPNDLR